VEGGRCRGVLALPPADAAGGHREPAAVRREPVAVLADRVVLATGGAGQMFAVTTNPREATGDGVAMALRAGVPVADVEFVQFHPTALHHPAMPRPLLSEALRGHGALLRDAAGDRFVDELAPRDVVSRAMAARMAAQGVDHLWLDATGLERFGERFPTIAGSLAAIGLDPSTDWLPIAPAAHHLSGGVVTDLWGATALPGLWAAGEVACTGVHGANRLASNSLLEGMVFGARLAEALASGRDGPTPSGALAAVMDLDRPGGAPGGAIGARAVPPEASASGTCGAPGPGAGREGTTRLDPAKLRDLLQRAMTGGAGVVRSLASMGAAGGAVSEAACLVAAAGREAPAVELGELANLCTLAGALLASARLREESRGAHTRVEHPGTDPSWRCRLVHGAVPAGAAAGPDAAGAGGAVAGAPGRG
ncbi:MAG: FAD-binding protein, partial [Acidimicrobiales bacterium]